MASETTSIERRVTGRSSLVLQGPSEALAGPLFAINWFNTRVAWVYHLYNWLAVERVRKIGGRPLFKGKVTETLSGDQALARKHLLIVNYPSAERFLDLVTDRLFQVVSLLRMLTVKEFSFVFHRRVDDGSKPAKAPLPWSNRHAFAVLHFGSNRPTEETIAALRAACGADDVVIIFAGQRIVTPSLQVGDAPPEPMPNVTENTVLLEAPQAATLRKLFACEQLTPWDELFSSYYAALVDRTL